MVNKWLETKITLIDKRQEEMGISPDEVDVRALIFLPSVIHIREVVSEKTEKVDPNEVSICLASGEDFHIKESYEKLKELIKKVHEQDSNI